MPRLAMDAGARGWLHRHARQNLWRVAAWYDIDDLLQEGYECWAYVCVHYPKVKDRPHMMRLFQLTYRSRLTDLAKRRTRDLDTLAELIVQPLRYEAELGTLAATIANAPEQVRAVLAVLTTELGRKRLRSPYRRYPGGTRETTNERLCRLTGYPRDVDLIAACRQYFGAR